MATTLSDLDSNETDPEPELPPDVLAHSSMLQDRCPEWLKTQKSLAVLTAAVGFTFLVLSYFSLWHTDLWGHLSYGRWIWEQGALPATEPLMTLANGMPMINFSWLSQLIGWGMYSIAGNEGLQFLYASSITACVILLLVRFYKRTNHVVWSLLGVGVFLWLEWQHLRIIRPQLAGMLCHVSLLTLLVGTRWHKRNWVVIPVLFGLWANLHGSFLIGIATLAALCVGRAIDVLRRTGQLQAVVKDNRVRRLFLLTELAAVAVLLNPYGLGIYQAALGLTANTNLQDLVEWDALNLKMKQGQAAGAIALALIFAYQFSPRRVSVAEVLLLLGFGMSALWVSRMIVWWAPVAAYCLVLHGSAAWKQFRKTQTSPAERQGKWSFISLGLVWICFAFTPFGNFVMHGRHQETERAVSTLTPLGAVKYLNEHPPQGQVFNTYEWGDYLLWAGPKNMQVFVASHAHLIPPTVWQHYMKIIHTSAGWDEVLDQYGVNTVVLDQLSRKNFITRMKREEKWKLDYEDSTAAVFVRKAPIL